MGENIWKPSKKKYGVAICNIRGNTKDGILSLTVGETVHILEEYGQGAKAWYRGTSFKQKDKMGIFPACFIHIKPYTVDNEGLYETVNPDEDNMVNEVAYVLREWSSILRTIFVRSDPIYKNIIRSMEELIKLRGQLVEKKLTSEDDRDIKKDIVGVIDWGNGKLGMDLVPRIDGQQVDADNCSIVRLHRVHVESAQIASNPGPTQSFRGKDSLVRTEHSIGAGVSTHHLLASFKNFGCNVGDLTETLLSIYTVKDGKSICLTEKFLVRHTKTSAPEDISKLNNIYALFTDLTNDDLEKDLYLVAHIYRIGRMLQENTKKSQNASFKRPWGVGVVGMPLNKLPAACKEYEFTMRVTCCADNELQFPTIQDQIIKKLQAGGSTQPSLSAAKLGLCLTISTRLLHGDLGTVKKEEPMMFNKGVALVQKLGVSDIITPELLPTIDGAASEVRNDLYVTLKEADFKRGSKTAEKNVELRVTVYDAKGHQIKNCISYGCGDSTRSEYFSSVYYHCNRPEWNETIRLSVPIDVFPGSHICFELFHCSVRKAAKKPFGFAFVRVTNKMQIVIKDDSHELCVYKPDDKFDMKKYLDLPFLVDDLNDPSNINRIPRNLMFKATERESLTISTMLCSGKFTQNGDLLGILNWRGDKGKISENLQKLCRMQGEEIVKFLHDILDALFELLMSEKDREDLSHQIVQALVNIFTLIHHQRFEMFKPVLDLYISDIFSAPLVHKPMCICFSEMIERSKEGGKTNLQLLQAFQAMDYIFRFIVQSREIQRKYGVFTQESGDVTDFLKTIEQLFQSMGNMLGSKSQRDVLKTYQVTLLGHLHMVYDPLLQVMSERDVCQLLVTCLREMSDVDILHDEITHVLLHLLRKTVNTPLFAADDSRALLLPLCLQKVETCLKFHKQMKLAVDLLGDILDMVYNLKQTNNIKEDIQKIISTMFDVVMDTVIYINKGHSSSMPMKVNKKLRKMAQRSQSHSRYTMKYERKLMPRITSGVAVKHNEADLADESDGTDEGNNTVDDKVSNTTDASLKTRVRMFVKDKPPAIQIDFSEITDQSHEVETEEINVCSPSPKQKVTFMDRLKTGKSSINNFMSLERPNKNRRHSCKDIPLISRSHSDTEDHDVDDSKPLCLGEDGPINNGAVISCLTEMIRLMEEEHYDALLHVYHRGPGLKNFLITILHVFRLLVKPKVFPKDWTVMRMVTNNVVFTAVEYLSQAIRDKYSTGENFDIQLWSSYFNLAITFISQPSLQLDQYSEAKAQKLKERYQDMRVLMGLQVTTLWQSLGSHKQQFIPSMVGPFLELTLVPERDLRKVTLPIIFDMMEVEQRKHHHFKEVEAALIERLDNLVTLQYHGDEQYKDLFKKTLLDRVQNDEVLKETGPRFITSITDLLEKLLDYRQVVDGEENKDKRMTCTFNILNFYKDEIKREEMYVRYVNKLHELHNLANNHVEAGLTLQQYAKMLTWGDKTIPQEMRYQQEPECKRKEMLYTQIINCFDKGKVWEYALPLCKDLAAFYESKLDYKKLGDILKLQASFYQKILEGVPGEDPNQPDVFFPRQDPSYYLVAYYGQTFPAFVRNKQFIYRGDECLRLATIMNHLNAEFPTAQVLTTKQKVNLDEIKQGDQQYFQIWQVKPVPDERPEFHGKEVPAEIRNFYNVNEVDRFEKRIPFHRGEVDKNNEIKTLCVTKTYLRTAYKFPGILRWYEVIETEEETLSPIAVAMQTIRDCNIELAATMNRCNSNPRLYFPQLEMRLNGVISAAVSGGISKYHEAFYTSQYELDHPEEADQLPELTSLLHEQLDILEQCMKLHGKLVPSTLQALHDNLESDFKKMKHSVRSHGHRSTYSTGSRIDPHSSTSTLGYCSDRSSSNSQEDDFPGVTHPDDLPLNVSLSDKLQLNHHGNDSPPPVPSRPRSMLLSGQGLQTPARPPTSFSPHNQGNKATAFGSVGDLTSSRLPTGGKPHRRPQDEREKRFKTQPIPTIPVKEKERRPSDPARPYGNSPTSPRSPMITAGHVITGDAGIPSLPAKTRDRVSQHLGHSPMGSMTNLQKPEDSSTTDSVPPLPPRKSSFSNTNARSRASEFSPSTTHGTPPSSRATINFMDPSLTSSHNSLSPGSPQIIPSPTGGHAPPPIPTRRADNKTEQIPPMPSPRNSNESRNSADSGFST